MIVHSPTATVRRSFVDLMEQLDPMPVMSTGVAGAACQDCSAGTGAECADDCPTRLALDAELLLEDLENGPEACCPSPEYAAAVLCGCGGYRRAVAS